MSDEKPHVPLHRERLNLPDNKEIQELNEKKKKQLRSDMQEVFNSPAGRRVLRYIINITGYGLQKIGGNPQIGMDLHAGLLYNCAREQVFLELKRFIPTDILKDAEFGTVSDLE